MKRTRLQTPLIVFVSCTYNRCLPLDRVTVVRMNGIVSAMFR